MPIDGWFDGKGIDLFKNALDKRKKEWDEIMADGVVSDKEIKKQKAIIINKLKRLEPELGESQHRMLTDVLIDYELLIRMLLYPDAIPDEETKGRIVSRDKKADEQ
jgi:hypothetical protein